MKTGFISDVNQIAGFLAERIIETLSRETLKAVSGQEQADAVLVFGNDLPYTAEFASEVFKKGIAKKMIFCGGIGHSTGRLRKAVGESPAYPWDTQELEDLTEAEIYARIACQIYKTDPADIYLDKESTNSGENAENALKIIKEHGIGKQILILIQDPLLQKRASASLKRYETESRIISYAPFIPRLKEDGAWQTEIKNLWSRERMLQLILGEISRLRDDENGYGPRGKDFIVHVDVPEPVIGAYERLKKEYPEIESGAR